MGFTFLTVFIMLFLTFFLWRSQNVRTVIGILAWFLILLMVGQTGFFNDASLPPRVPLLILPCIIGIVYWTKRDSFDRLNQKIPIPLAIGVQAFRVVVEILIHQTYLAGNLPQLVTYEGLNFDIIVGATAIPISLLLYYKILPKSVVYLWNIIGIGILTFTVFTFVSAFYFKELFSVPQFPMIVGNTPYIFLPGMMVPFAILMHVVSIRQLRSETKKAT